MPIEVSMNKVGQFLKMTMIGGLVVILPVALIVFLLLKAMTEVQKVLQPIVSLLPEEVILPKVMALLIVIGGCFLTGLVLKTRIGRQVYQVGERQILERLPGYTLLRDLSRQFSGQEEGVSFSVALVEIEEALVPAFLVEEHEDGSFTVFVPSSPTPTVGALYILPPERVHPVKVSFAKAVKCLTRWGVGSGELLRAMRSNSTGVT
jgi:uncharacterized membrane protein